MINRKRRGELSELAFFYKATSLGFNLSKPWGDSSRYDFIVEHHGHLSRVQVKSTSQLWNPGKRPRTTVVESKPTGGYYLNCQRRMKGGTYPYTPDEVDFFAAHIVPLDTWYILPISAIGSKYYLLFFPHLPARDRRLASYREAWHLLKACPERRPGGTPIGISAVIPSERDGAAADRAQAEGPCASDHPITRSPDHPMDSEHPIESDHPMGPDDPITSSPDPPMDASEPLPFFSLSIDACADMN